MAALYTDENVKLALEDELRPLGHAATSTFAERRLGAPDPHQLLYAAERGWTIITHNRRDFRLLHTAWLLWSHTWRVSRSHAGILVLEQIPDQPVADLARLIDAIVNDPATTLTNALYDWKPGTGWTRFAG